MEARVVAKAVILNQNNEVLLLRRSPTDDRRPGEQDFPGGGIDKGEILTAGMSREISEETGLIVALCDLSLIYAATQLYDTESVTRLLFWAKVDTPTIKLSYEHDDFQWVAPDKAVEQFPHPFYGAGLAYALKHHLLPL